MLELSGSYLGVTIGIIVVILLLVILASEYVKSPPDTAFIISGLRKKTAIGETNIKIPFLERLDKLSLKLIPTDMKTPAAVPTADYIDIRVDAVVNVKINGDPGRLAMAAENFLNQNMKYIGRATREILEGNIRKVVGRMKLGEMVSDRQRFAELVKENTIPDLAAMGLNIISFNTQNFSDNNGVIDDLGIDNISQIRKKAAIAKVEADKEIAVARAEADKQANDAKIDSDRKIAIKNNGLDIQKMELRENADVKQAEADAAYQIQEEQQRKTIKITTAETNIAKQEKEIIVKQRMVEMAEKALGAGVRKKTEADGYARQQKAEAGLCGRQRNAEMKRFEVQQETGAQKPRAEAERLTREQKAQGIYMVDDTEAEVIRAKGVAEAEAIEKKAEAYQKYTGAAIAGMIAKVLLEVTGKIAEPLAQVDRTTTIGGGSDNNGVDNVAGNVTTVIAKLFESMKETTGIDLGRIVKANAYDAKVNRNIRVAGISEGDMVGGEIVKNTIEDSMQ